MYERTRSPSSGYQSATAKMASDIGPRKTMFVIVVVVGCFAILWPKVFYPMLVGSANQHIKPSKIDKTTGCCDVFSEVDLNTIKIMSELCSSIIQQTGQNPLSGKEIVIRCKLELQQTCGIDISGVLQEQFRLGLSVKQILSEVRSLNGSLCLKYHYGVAPWRLGVPHRIAVNITSNVKQERPPHMRPDIIHPAFREKGSAIPKPSSGPAKRQPKIVEGRPGPIPGMRPTLGGAGHVIPSQKTGSSMSVIMPIYTIGIVIFFSYTLMKLLFKRQPDGVGGSLYPPIEPDPRFRKEVFESARCKFTPRLSRDPTGKIVVNAMSALLDEVNQEIEARRIANQEIYLQGALPAQSQILVTESAVVTEPAPSDINTDPAVVLAGKMTLSVISLDSMHENEKPVNEVTPPPIEVAPAVENLDINGDTEDAEEEPPDESKYTTASSATVAENEISEDEGSDNQELDDDDEDIEKINNFEIEVNNIAGVNGAESKDEMEEDIEEDIEEVEVVEEEIEFEVEDDEEIGEDIEEIGVEDIEEAEEIEIDVDGKIDGVIEIDEEMKDEDKIEKDEVGRVEERIKEDGTVRVDEILEIDDSVKNEDIIEINDTLADEELVEVDEKLKYEERIKEDDKIEDKEVEIDEKVKLEERIKEDDKVKDEEIIEIDEKVQDEEKVKDDNKLEYEEVVADEELKDEERIKEDAKELEEIIQIDEKVQDVEKAKYDNKLEYEEIVEDEELKDEDRLKVDDKVKEEEIIEIDERVEDEERAKEDDKVKTEEIIEKKEKLDVVEIVKNEEKMQIEERVKDDEKDEIVQNVGDEKILKQEEVRDKEEVEKEGVLKTKEKVNE